MAKINVSTKKIGDIDKALFSSFVEQMGRAVYGGIYQPGHPSADEDGFRRDVIKEIKELNIKYVRYPGGNFVSNYRWKDGIGKNRVPVYDIVWKQYEPNLFGIDEFMAWAKKTDIEPIMAVNLGSGSPDEAAELVEYCNCETGYWAEQRKLNGHEKPYGIKYWCLGNEMDGEWQIGFKSAEDYAKIAKEAAVKMKDKDPTIKLVVCGSSSFDMPSCPDWDKTVLDVCFDEVDFLSMHKYYCYDKKPENIPTFMAVSQNLDQGFRKIKGIIEEIKQKKGSGKNIYISFDEWNIWYSGQEPWEGLWTLGPKRVENVYTAIDATVFASLMSSMLNHCDVVKIACLAQLVNVIAPIMTTETDVYKQTIYYPFKAISDNASGSVYACTVDCDERVTETYGKVKTACATFTYDESKEEGTLLFCNFKNCNERFNIELNDFIDLVPYEIISMSGLPDLANTAEAMNEVTPEVSAIRTKEITAKPYSWNVVKYKK